MRATKTTTERTRGKRGHGRLYIRNKQGKEFKAGTSNVKDGCYWLEYLKPTGKMIKVEDSEKEEKKKVRTKLLNGNDQPITTIEDARRAQENIIRQYVTATKKERLNQIKATLEEAGTELEKAIEEAKPPLSIADAWETYESNHERPDSGEGTLSRYKGYWTKFREWFQELNPDAKYLRDINSRHVQNYATHLVKIKASPNTFNKHTSFLKLFFRTLEDAARLKANPFERIKRKKLKTETRRELTLEELKTILETANGELKTLLYIGTFTGLRLGDCATLKWGEIDLIRGIIRRVPGKTKSQNGKVVTIGIPAALHVILSDTPKSKRKGYVVPNFADRYTFENAKGKRIRQSLITDQVQALFRKLGINTHKEGTGTQIRPNPDKPGEYIEEKTGKRAVVEVGFHSLRHTYVSIQAEAGTPQAVVQAIVGHGNPSMTAHYTHIGEQAAQQAALAMPSNIIDADYEVLPDPLPPWAKELAEKLNSKNWKSIKAGLLANA